MLNFLFNNNDAAKSVQELFFLPGKALRYGERNKEPFSF